MMNKLSSYIDHTLLKPEASVVQIEQLCKEAMENEFESAIFPMCNAYL